MCVTGLHKKQLPHVFIDISSTYNFLDSKIAKLVEFKL